MQHCVCGLLTVAAVLAGVLLSATVAKAELCLDDGTVYATTNEPADSPPFSVLACDVNGDGELDVVTANDADDTVAVLLNNGDGTFSSPVRWPVGDNPQETLEPVAVDCCDVDGDELVDLVTVNHTSDDISILFNDGTAGGIPQFAVPVRYAVGEAPWEIRCLPIDDDSHVDIVTANFTADSISILLNTGSGTFGSHVMYGAGDAPIAMALCDVDNDSDQDVVTANMLSKDVSVLRNNSDGTFTGIGSFSVDVNPFDVTCCDLDGVNGPDVATANGIADTVTVLFNDGTGSYGGLTSYGGVDGAYAVTCCDLDSGTDSDIVSANLVSDDLAVFLNDGSGTLGAPSFYPVGSNPSSVKSADIVGGSATDLVVAFADGIRVFANDCSPDCGDGVCEETEEPCTCPDDCGPPDMNELPGSTCADGSDNDCDGLTDCEDSDCTCGDLDADRDGDLDLADYSAFQRCFGPGPLAKECELLDVNGDNDIDLEDFAESSGRWTGPS